MHENLKTVLKMMLFMSDQQLLDEDFDKINFKKQGWFKKYTWTAKREIQFIQWLTEHLKKNWQGIAEFKPTTAKLRQKIANEFVFNYGCVIRPLNIKDFTDIVPWGQLNELMSGDEREAFDKWMFGQTTSLHGVYRSDLERYLNGLK